ncbi:MAG: cryptochrome/photolyase family protein [Myxococcota bacterium]|nr:cryptochrome/photolyase family protein [Myxococcota bacterium]
MSVFGRELADRQSDPDDRRWLFVPYDQLSDAVGPLSREDPGELGIVLVENLWKPRRRPYHRQKLALVLASLRHFALEQAERGVAVRHVAGDAPYAKLLEPLARELGPLRVMEPAERELRADLAPLVRKKLLEVVPHEGWLTTPEQFEEAFGGGRTWRMDAFYRLVRQRSGILMKNGKPVGGKYSFDADNRKSWSGKPPAPKLPRFPLDPVKEEVAKLVESVFSAHPGRLDPDDLPATAADAKRAWRFAKRHCMELFGPYEDAMSRKSRTLFHTKVSALLNNLRLLPETVVNDVAAMKLPLPSQEGFIRQVLGWREFMHHVHVATDGFRRLPDGSEPPVAPAPGDAGYARWSGKKWRVGRATARIDGGAAPSALEAEEPLPAAFWGEASGLGCLDQVVSDVWETGYGHHITRLMVLSNLGTLLGVSPRELTDWFWVAYTDAYDWVVEPNVLGMGTFGLGDLFVTKPYVSGAAYIDRMSDYCGECAFSPKKDCPITSLYWSFMDRNQEHLAGNQRVAMPLRSLAKRPAKRRDHDRRVAKWVRDTLAKRETLRPEDRPEE